MFFGFFFPLDVILTLDILIHLLVFNLFILYLQMQRLSAKRGELERKLHTTSAERDTMASSLKETNDRCLMLDKHSRELDQQVHMDTNVIHQ